MKARLLLAAFLIALSTANRAPAAQPAAKPAGGSGDVYLLGVALDQAGAPGGWARVGPEGAWKNTLAGAVVNGRLYSTESDGALYVTHLDSGAWEQVGKNEFGNTRFMFSSGNQLYTLETNGCLYRVDPANGKWAQVGPTGAWGGTTAGAVLGGRLFTADKDGSLYAADLTGDGSRKHVGKPEAGTVRWLASAAGTARKQLHAINEAGDLYDIDPADAKSRRIGRPGEWKQTNGLGVLDGQLYTTESTGAFRRTDPRTGRHEAVGKAEFGATKFLFTSAGLVYTIETDGSLYRVTVKPNMDDFDWCPLGIEKVFREQGAPFRRGLEVKQVLGSHATHAGILAGFSWLREKAKNGDLAVVYIGAHGNSDPKDGWSIATADDKTLRGREIKAELAKLPCQALVFVETCTSGGFAHAHPNDPPLPANVTALCACQENQTTNNQLDLAVAEALYGRADFNHDGQVDVDELTRYVRFRYEEWWPHPKPGDDSETPVVEKAKGLEGSTPLTKVAASLSAVAVGDDLWSALLEKQSGGQYQVHLLGWSSKPGEPYFVTNAVPRDAICLPEDGPPLLVESGSEWLPARRVRENGGKMTVHLLGKQRDETVEAKRVRYPFAGGGK